MQLFRRRRAQRPAAVDLVSAEQRAATSAITGRCPRCAGESALDKIDLVDRVMQLHCIRCGHVWEDDEAELSGSGA